MQYETKLLRFHQQSEGKIKITSESLLIQNKKKSFETDLETFSLRDILFRSRFQKHFAATMRNCVVGGKKNCILTLRWDFDLWYESFSMTSLLNLRQKHKISNKKILLKSMKSSNWMPRKKIVITYKKKSGMLLLSLTALHNSHRANQTKKKFVFNRIINLLANFCFIGLIILSLHALIQWPLTAAIFSFTIDWTDDLINAFFWEFEVSPEDFWWELIFD